MAIQIGQQLGSLEVTALLGKGGMGEVYRARDTKLKRDVAIKILPDEFARDADRISRFQREAEVLASLSHPNIAGIYDLQHTDETQFLVLELVEGETLADRIKRGPLPVGEALQIGKSISEALEAAHEKGIVHRDLKPANVKITPDGTVKVLDFGLAKMGQAQSSSVLSNSPTLLSASMPGAIIGTASYMSPEQARGRTADPRSDIFSFGCMLYEMLTGKQAFEGDDVSDILAAVLRAEPDFGLLPANVNPRLYELIRRCLAKNRRDRWHAIGDVRFEIEAEITASPAKTGESHRKLGQAWVMATALFVVISIVLGSLYLRSRSASPDPIHLFVVPPEGTDFGEDPSTATAVISPDGEQIAFITGNGNSAKLWIRSLHNNDSHSFEGSDGAAAPFWSPDSRWVGFFANGKLYHVDTRGGKPQIICTLETDRGQRASATWNGDGTILFALDTGRPLSRVSAEGGPVTGVTSLDKSGEENGHFRPAFLPDGKHFLFLALRKDPKSGVYLGSLDSKETRPILVGVDTPAYYVPSGQLLFVRNSTLFAQDFDLKHFELRNMPVHITDSVFTSIGNAAFAAFSVSETGTLVYRTGKNEQERQQTQLTWFDRSGNVLETIGSIGLNRNPRLSPDGTRAAVQIGVGALAVSSVWVLGPGNISSRVAESGFFPMWSSDGRQLVYLVRVRDGKDRIVQKSVTAEGNEEQVLYSPAPLGHLDDLAPDGKYAVVSTITGQTNRDVIAVPLEGAEKPIKIAATSAQEIYGRISPDGHWIAYSSDESGVSEVYVQAYPRAGSKTLVSRNGGTWPVWRRDGKELFYTSADGMKLMVVSVSGTTVLQPGAPQTLFDVRLIGIGIGSPSQYDVTSDGQRFLINSAAANSEISPIHVVLNWTELLKR
jgi:serine/threonine protein kinase